MKHIYFAIMAFTTMAFASCSDSDTFTLKGRIEGAPDKKMAVQRCNSAGQWVTLDSLSTDGDGDFKTRIPASNVPDIYRVETAENTYAYFPVDSTETITLTARFADPAATVSLEGSEQAALMGKYQRTARDFEKKPGGDREAFKKQMFSTYINNRKGDILSYYVLTSRVGDAPLYDSQSGADARYYAAVATAFEQFRPDDPRTQWLKDTSIAALRLAASAKGQQRIVEADQVGFIDFELNDAKGHSRRLSDVAGKGKPAILAFTIMTDPSTPELNRELRRLRDERGAEVFQVSFDSDLNSWRSAATNLPWTNVLDQTGTQSKLPATYNFSTLPVFFLIDASGQIMKRAATPSELF